MGCRPVRQNSRWNKNEQQPQQPNSSSMTPSSDACCPNMVAGPVLFGDAASHSGEGQPSKQKSRSHLRRMTPRQEVCNLEQARRKTECGEDWTERPQADQI